MSKGVSTPLPGTPGFSGKLFPGKLIYEGDILFWRTGEVLSMQILEVEAKQCYVACTYCRDRDEDYPDIFFHKKAVIYQSIGITMFLNYWIQSCM